jgi:hypothetical protein
LSHLRGRPSRMRQEVSPLSPLFTDDAGAESNDGRRIIEGARRSRE